MTPADNKVDTKAALLRAAEELFCEKGYAAISTRELAERADVNLGAIQYHFGSKVQLFVEAIRSMLSRQGEHSSLFSFTSNATSKSEAAIELCRVIRVFLEDLCHPQGPDVCRMMHREVLSATAQNTELFEVLVSSVVEEFFRPVDNHFLRLVRVLCPGISEREAVLTLHSLYGQCTYYATDRPFIEGLRGVDFANEPVLTEVCNHIASFTLRGMGFKESEVQKALAEVEK
ncbi:TetR/AcrR family transcriptional regulator [Oligoflexia bacterium]|nr:TetR/AcrR family transcriptional regulator [Oligoflexia bacterium]